MKKPIFFGYALVLALLFNLKIWDGGFPERLKSTNFLPLCILTTCGFYVYAWWISRQYGKFLRRLSMMTTAVDDKLLLRKQQSTYVLWAAGIVLIAHLLLIWCMASMHPRTWPIMWVYGRDYMPVLALLVFGYTFLLLYRPEFAIENSFPQKEVEIKEVLPESVNERVGLYTLFAHLKLEAAVGPIFREMDGLAVRFFDIAAIEVHSKVHYVILSSGEKLQADHLLHELKGRGLDGWMLKINKNYYINMMLVSYPIAKPNLEIAFVGEVYRSILQRMSEEDLKKMCKVGPGRRDAVANFLADNDGMEFEGWDSFVPLR